MMGMQWMYITNDPQVAMIAEKNGVNWVFIDLEIRGKQERQGHLDTVISNHHIEDIAKVKAVLSQSKLLVRINPLHSNSKEEINQVIEQGADSIMLPFFTTTNEVEAFITYVDKRTETFLLLETPQAVEKIDEILKLQGIDRIHIGLNDLHLGYKMHFMFEPLVNGTVEKITRKINIQKIPYGFGGIARLGQGDLPAEDILAEHYRLGSNMCILSRSFCNTSIMRDLNTIEQTFNKELGKIKFYELELQEQDEVFFERNRLKVKEKVWQMIDRKIDLFEKKA